MSGKHFIDTNILIGFTVKWDIQREPSRQYFSQTHVEYFASPRIHNEAKKVVESCRRKTLQVIDRIRDEFEAGSSLDVMGDVRRFVHSQFDELKSPVLNYIEHQRGKVQNMLLNGDDSSYIELIKSVKQDFKLPLVMFRKLKAGDLPITYFKRTHSDYERVYPDKKRALSKCMTNMADRDVALDAYHLLQFHSLEGLSIATLDRGDFVAQSEDIERILPGVVILDVLDTVKDPPA